MLILSCALDTNPFKMAIINAGLMNECGFIWTFVIAFSRCFLNSFFRTSVKVIEECNLNKKRKVLIVFDDMIAGMLCDKKIKPIVIELFIRGRKLKISPDFITQPYCSVLKILEQILHLILL